MTDDQWELLACTLLREHDGPGRPIDADRPREYLDAIFYVLADQLSVAALASRLRRVLVAGASAVPSLDQARCLGPGADRLTGSRPGQRRTRGETVRRGRGLSIEQGQPGKRAARVRQGEKDRRHQAAHPHQHHRPAARGRSHHRRHPGPNCPSTITQSCCSAGQLLAAVQALVEDIQPMHLHHASADLLAGSLGLVAGLLAANSIGASVPEWLIESAATRLAEATAELRRAMTDGSEPAFVGYSHGLSSIAAVSAAMAGVGWLDAAATTTVARELLADESSRYSEPLACWPDHRNGNRSDWRAGPGWCNGAAGIALARAVLLTIPDPELHRLLRRDLDRAVRQLDRDVLAVDNLCCGTARR